MRDVTVHQKRDGWTAVKTRKKKSDDKPPRQECHSLSTMSFQSNDSNLQSYAHLFYITPSLLKRKTLPSNPRTPLSGAGAHFKSINEDLTSTIKAKACRCMPFRLKSQQNKIHETCSERDESMFARWRPPLDWAALVESRSWTWSLLAPGGGAVSTWLLWLRWVPW